MVEFTNPNILSSPPLEHYTNIDLQSPDHDMIATLIPSHFKYDKGVDGSTQTAINDRHTRQIKGYYQLKQVIGMQTFDKRSVEQDKQPCFTHREKGYLNQDLQHLQGLNLGKKQIPYKIPITPFKYFHRRLQSTSMLNSRNGSCTDHNSRSETKTYQQELPSIKEKQLRPSDVSFGGKHSLLYHQGTQQQPEDPDQAVIHSKIKDERLYQPEDVIRQLTAQHQQRRQSKRQRMKSEDLSNASYKLPTTIDVFRQRIDQDRTAMIPSILKKGTQYPKDTNQTQPRQKESEYVKGSVLHQKLNKDQSQDDQSNLDLSFGEGSPVRGQRSSEIVQSDVYGLRQQNFSDFKISPFVEFSPYGETENIFESYDQRQNQRRSELEVKQPSLFKNQDMTETSSFQRAETEPDYSAQRAQSRGNEQSLIYFNEACNTSQKSSLPRKKLPVQNKKLRQIFRIPNKSKGEGDDPVSQSNSISKFLQGVEIAKHQFSDEMKKNDTPSFRKTFRNSQSKMKFTHHPQIDKLPSQNNQQYDLLGLISKSKSQQKPQHSRNRSSTTLTQNNVTRLDVHLPKNNSYSNEKALNRHSITSEASRRVSSIPLEQQLEIVERLFQQEEKTKVSPQRVNPIVRPQISQQNLRKHSKAEMIEIQHFIDRAKKEAFCGLSQRDFIFGIKPQPNDAQNQIKVSQPTQVAANTYKIDRLPIKAKLVKQVNRPFSQEQESMQIQRQDNAQ